MNDVLILYSDQWITNKYGVQEPNPEPTKKEVFCEKHSVSRSEFFNAGRNGLNPQFVFTMFAGDYDGETECEYDGDTYSIYRTYLTDSDYIELYVERKGGMNGKNNA